MGQETTVWQRDWLNTVGAGSYIMERLIDLSVWLLMTYKEELGYDAKTFYKESHPEAKEAE
jgi:hypothetical protein